MESQARLSCRKNLHFKEPHAALILFLSFMSKYRPYLLKFLRDSFSFSLQNLLQFIFIPFRAVQSDFSYRRDSFSQTNCFRDIFEHLQFSLFFQIKARANRSAVRTFSSLLSSEHFFGRAFVVSIFRIRPSWACVRCDHHVKLPWFIGILISNRVFFISNSLNHLLEM